MTYNSKYGGLFQDPVFISTDADPKKTDPYDHAENIPSRYLGKGFTVGHTAPGVLPESFFGGKYLTLASVEQNNGKPVSGEDAATQQRREAMESKKKNMGDKEFRYTSFPQKSTGPGSYYGCIQNRPFEYMTEPWEENSKASKKQRKRQQAAAAAAAAKEEEYRHLPNIKTNPAKKGTYGVPGTLLDNPKYNDDWRGELEADTKAEQKRSQRRGPEPKPLDGPFHVSGVSRAFLDEMPNTGVSAVYTIRDVPDNGKPASKKKRRTVSDTSAPTLTQEKPFHCAASKTGQQGCLNPFPNVWVHPDEVDAAASKSSRRKRKAAADQEAAAPVRPKGAGEWMPNSFSKTSVVSSCLRRFY